MKIELEKTSEVARRVAGEISGGLTHKFQVYVDLSGFHGKAWLTYDGELSTDKKSLTADERLIKMVGAMGFTICNHFQIWTEEYHGQEYRTLSLKINCESEKKVRLHLAAAEGYPFALVAREIYNPEDEMDTEFKTHISNVVLLNGEYYFSPF